MTERDFVKALKSWIRRSISHEQLQDHIGNSGIAAKDIELVDLRNTNHRNTVLHSRHRSALGVVPAAHNPNAACSPVAFSWSPCSSYMLVMAIVPVSTSPRSFPYLAVQLQKPEKLKIPRALRDWGFCENVANQ